MKRQVRRHARERAPRHQANILASPSESRALDPLTRPGVAEDAKPFVGFDVQAALKGLESRMRDAAANLEFEQAAKLRDDPEAAEPPEGDEGP